jgi:hypothetical protein
MAKRNQHVVPAGGRWTVRSAGAQRASRIFPTQEEAVEHAREKARRDGKELFIHGRDGRVQERSSYSREATPAKG